MGAGERTDDALVGGVEEGDEVARTRLDDVAQAGHLQLTRASAGADAVEQVHDAHRAPDVAVVT